MREKVLSLERDKRLIDEEKVILLLPEEYIKHSSTGKDEIEGRVRAEWDTVKVELDSLLKEVEQEHVETVELERQAQAIINENTIQKREKKNVYLEESFKKESIQELESQIREIEGREKTNILAKTQLLGEIETLRKQEKQLMVEEKNIDLEILELTQELRVENESLTREAKEIKQKLQQGKDVLEFD